ncbi:RNF216 [Lepeophtheirus salmonis]|uniref:RNF216 n=1 Tax=Lepeophtheirus salmonis TaxID=72036 RepID=A0A7R8D6R9_LEPSM|nr:RNF216 [Lepeophtheirus salmonis]CAF3020338.1 RNF216 [Lepeophtheirus salmonis]
MDKLIHEIVSCPGGHFFCKDCARKGCEGLVQGSRIVYKCFEPKCEEAFDTQTLSELINPKLFSKYVQGICKEEIKSCFKLEDCPECDYGVVIEDESIMIIECQYEFCGVRSCRRCKKRAHKLGESCSLSDSDNHFVANKMSEAVIRRCYSCKKPYQKFEGCNSVKCECGAKMCYICRTPLKGGYHNNRSRECSSSVNMVSLHEIERRKAEEEARSSLGATGTSFANL